MITVPFPARFLALARVEASTGQIRRHQIRATAERSHESRRERAEHVREDESGVRKQDGGGQRLWEPGAHPKRPGRPIAENGPARSPAGPSSSTERARTPWVAHRQEAVTAGGRREQCSDPGKRTASREKGRKIETQRKTSGLRFGGEALSRRTRAWRFAPYRVRRRASEDNVGTTLPPR